MLYLWEIVLQALIQGKQEADLFFTQAKEYSPYLEQSFPSINENQIEQGEIELNVLVRFMDIFQEILSPGLREELLKGDRDFREFRNYLIDAALHTLFYSDLRAGLSKRDIYINKIISELLSGQFWSAAAPRFAFFDHGKQNRLVSLLLNQMQTGSSLFIFRRAARILFPDLVLYQLKAERKKLLLYLKDKPTDVNQEMLRIVIDMFLPVRYQLKIFWKYHFGVIGVDATMVIDEIALY